jgi:hypothetical protein
LFYSLKVKKRKEKTFLSKKKGKESRNTFFLYFVFEKRELDFVCCSNEKKSKRK